MHEPTYTSVYRFERFRAEAIAFPQHIAELEEEQRAFRAWLRLLRIRQGLLRLLDYWPLALGLVLGVLAPHLRALLLRRDPWTMWVVFPFVLLAGRPEIHADAHLANVLPAAILYLQFPVEGLIVQWAMRQQRSVTVSGVAGRVLYLHYLCLLQLLMISGAVGQALM
ncbi:MAG TPA: hypothetical protein VHD85_13880 [Terracidiphilus sp.]|nr:hypothetical protein [Terracidiphilus sp.]